MGGWYVAVSRGWRFKGILTTFAILVLRQIEQEDAQWHSKQKAAKEQEKATQEPEKKDSAARDSASDNEATEKTQSPRKVNFF